MATNASNARPGLLSNPLRRLGPSWRKALRSPPVLGLITVLVIQVGAAVYLAGQGLQRNVPDESLLAFSPQQVSGIEIVADGETMRLERRAEGWVLPALDGFPADNDKVEQLLVQLSELPRSIPVAASAESRQRLAVADENVDTRLKLLGAGGGVLAELLTGDSPGFRRLYGRVAGEEEVYDLPLAGFQLTSDSDDWVQRDHLRLDVDAIDRISAEGWTLRRDADERWRLEGEERAVDQVAADTYVRRLANLTYQGVEIASGEDQTPAGPALALQIRLEDGTVHQRRIIRGDDDGYLMITGPGPRRYVLSEYDLDGVLEIGPDALTESAEPEAVAGAPAGPTEPATDSGDAAATDGSPRPDEDRTAERPAEAETQGREDASRASAAEALPAPPAESAGAAAGTEAATGAEVGAETAADSAKPGATPGAAAVDAEATDTAQPAAASAAAAAEADAASAAGADGESGGESQSQPEPQEATRQADPTRQPRWPYQQRYAPPPQPHWPPQNPPPQRAPPPGWR